MAWIQKNLMLVLGGLVGLVLLLGSALFLYSQYGREATVNTALEEKRAEWNRLIGLSPFPDEKNIKAVKDDTAQLEKLAAELRGNIHPFEVPPIQDTFSLKLLIETTISDLRKEAENAGVGLPHNYAFTFQRLREMPQFQSNAIPRLAEQVVEVSTLLRVLFDAKVHTLD
ncbi:MAG: Amuc_1100 family pilus-like protein, partial [Planctomycetota bacterium]|nr:Amuc_1100 family pilus-like protein [Planctomycetota bacterium]